MVIENEGMHIDYGIENPILGYLFYFLTGQIFSAYWYIPLIMVVFFLSPLFVKLIDIKPSIWVVLGLLVIPLFIQRPVQNINILQSFIYFVPVYILGSWVSVNSEQIHRALKGKTWWLLLAILVLAYIQAIYYPYSGNAHKNAFELSLIDINFIQKIIMCFFLLIFFQQYENRDFRLLVFLAEVSFPIYFLHPFIITILGKLKWEFYNNFSGSLLTFIFTTALVIFISASTAILGRKIIGRKYSRSLIGW